MIVLEYNIKLSEHEMLDILSLLELDLIKSKKTVERLKSYDFLDNIETSILIDCSNNIINNTKLINKFRSAFQHLP